MAEEEEEEEEPEEKEEDDDDDDEWDLGALTACAAMLLLSSGRMARGEAGLICEAGFCL